jgi:hypothetical protein
VVASCGSGTYDENHSLIEQATMRTLQLIAATLLTLALPGCTTVDPSIASSEITIRRVLDEQVREWNAGNLRGFMEVYDKSSRTRFASGGDVSLGWQTVFDRYQSKYIDRAAMGMLTFSDLEITMLSPELALAFGRWHLKREKDEPSGLFSLVLRKRPEGWRIVHDHTSAATPK